MAIIFNDKKNICSLWGILICQLCLKNKRVEYITELIEMFNLPFTGWDGFLILTRTSSKTSVAGKRKNKIKKS